MLAKIKNLSLMTKLLYIFAFILFVVWVIPKMNAYYSSVNNYQKNIKELEEISSKHGVVTRAQKFSATIFKEDSESIFSKVELKNLEKNIYEVHITMRKEDLKSFHTFIETLSLRYYVEIQGDLEFKTKAEIVNVMMILKAF